MTQTNETLDPPWAYLPRDRRRALAAGRPLPTAVEGAALFADISGFTPLTEALADELGSQHASEVLTGHLNRVFHAVIEELDRRGGDVIYFSGDAITCWLDGDDGTRAVDAALGMQAAIEREGEIRTPAGRELRLGLKVAVAAGAARRFVVGDPGVQLIDVLAGSLVDRLAEVEHVCETGEVVVDPAAAATLAGTAELGASRPVAGGEARVVVRGPDGVATGPAGAEALDDELARPWLLPPVYERLSAGRGEFLAELRPAFPVFVSFTGIDYDVDPAAPELLDAFVRSVQRIFSAHGGNVLQLTLGDKGAYLYGVFGTPYAHEDDAARACAAALELQSLDVSTAAREIRIGIAHGRLRSGTYGHAARRTFVCLGDAVNLAARLMGRAPAGETYASESVQRLAGQGLAWTALEPLQLKGKSAAVHAYALDGATGIRSRRVQRYARPLVGRTRELALLRDALADAERGRGRLVGISAEAGLGKSRLLAEFVREARGHGQLVAFGECVSYGSAVRYAVWREIWRTLLHVPDMHTDEEQIGALEQAVAAIDPMLLPRVPLLAAVVGLPIPDSDLTASLDPKLRKTSLESLLAECLRACARDEPLVLVLEDCHWLDPLSRDLLDVLARVALGTRVLLVLAYRPDTATPEGGAGLAGLHGLEHVELDALDDDGMRAVLCNRLGGEAPEALLQLVAARAQGNPFYAEEILGYVKERGVDPTSERALRELELPGSLHSLVLGRIDTVAEAPRRTLKVASVAGRTFRAPLLCDVYPDLGAHEEVAGNLGRLTALDLVSPDREDDESYVFKHAIIHEVAYESLPYALRATLHARFGRSLERASGNLDLLAHHFWLGDDEERKREYLRRAADAAQAAYANEAAIDYYERLAPLVGDEERAEVLLELGKVLELVGRWDEAREQAEAALVLGGGAWAEVALAELARKQGAYPEAEERLARARTAFEDAGDEHGTGRVLHLEGTLAAQGGRYADSAARYEASLAIRRRLGDHRQAASVLSNLGVVAEYEGDYPKARAYHEDALALRGELGDRWGIAVSMTNLGMIALLQERHAEARTHFEEALRLNREVGDTWMVANGNNNLGNANRGLGELEAARSSYAESLRMFGEYDDRWSLAFLLEDVAVLASLTDAAADAFYLLGAADALRAEIASPRGDALDEEIRRRLDGARTLLGDTAAAEAHRLGESEGLEAALVVALAVCRG